MPRIKAFWRCFLRSSLPSPRSTGSTSAAAQPVYGLLFWAWSRGLRSFPSGCFAAISSRPGRFPPELWNVPKYFVAFGMILTLLEDEFLAAGRAMEHYRLLFAAHPHPMWVHDPETLRILEVNDAAVAHYGYSREEFQSMTLPRSAAWRRRGRDSQGEFRDQFHQALRPLASPPERRLLHSGGYGVASHRLHGTQMQFRPGPGRHRSPATA